jgi:signal peptidase II
VRRTAAFLGALGAVVVVDQITKTMVSASMTIGQSIPLIRGLLSLTYIRNRGIAFGLFNHGGGSLKIVLLTCSTLLALAFLLWLLKETPRDDLFGGTAIGLVAGGALGNLIDRLRLGEVTDFIDVYWRTHHWPFFNAADSAITIGVILLMAQQVFDGERGKKEMDHAA